MSIETYFEQVMKNGLRIREVTRVVTDRCVYILGYKLDLQDLYRTLKEIEDDPSGTYINNTEMSDLLKDIGAIENNSRSMGILCGPNFTQFLQMVTEKYRVS